jgi:hypothetical protein
MLIKQNLTQDLPSKFNNCDVHFVDKYKYLGVDIDNRLNFIPNLDNLGKN